ncbi:MAG: AI-2E family transporter [Candidatus Faecousia sp.]|nr:AI-2E family transporter [Clostridiales bacterium]MDY6180521.1 AI-2E family transporter [Candidatus Faecousia sp.]
MHIDKKVLKNLFFLAGSCILLVWLLLYTEQVSSLLAFIWSLISPFVVGAGIAFVFNVPMRAIERQLEGIRKPGPRRILAILLTLGALILVLAFVVELLIPQIQATVESLAESIPQFVKRQAANLTAWLAEHPELQEWVVANTELENIDWTSVLQKAGSIVGDSMSTIVDGAFSAIGSVTGAIVNAVISVVFAIYCLSRKEILARQGRRLLYSLLPEHFTDEVIRIMRLTNSTFSNFISGQCLEACILGCLFAVTMLILKMPYIPLVSVVIAVTALVPVVGAFVGCVLGAFFILVDNPLQAVTFVIMFLILQQLENNLIYPRVVGTSIGLPGMWVLVAVTIGGEIMGVGGMLVMIPLASVLYTLLREFTDKRLAEREIPAEKLMDQPPEIKSRFQRSQERRQRRYFMKMKDKLRNMQEKKKRE